MISSATHSFCEAYWSVGLRDLTPQLCPIMPCFLCGCCRFNIRSSCLCGKQTAETSPQSDERVTKKDSLVLQSLWLCWCEIFLMRVLSLLWCHHISWDPHESWTEASIMPLNSQNYVLKFFIYKINMPWVFYHTDEKWARTDVVVLCVYHLLKSMNSPFNLC